ncbi:hypothetical protein EH227_22585 [Rouxiella chamberiensis]|nr:hypothetical protein EH227_22585 [Rouxiella chamberiensis]
MPNMPLVEGYSEFFILRDQETGAPLTGLPYTLTIAGEAFDGITDEHGHTRYAWTSQSDEIEVIPHPEQFMREIVNARYWDEDNAVKLDFSHTDKEDE